MKYQRVLYTNKLTAEMKSRLRIASFRKRRSFKKNVYFVSFTSNADMKIADGIAKQTRNITLKPIKPLSSETQREHRISICSNQEGPRSSSSPLTFLSPPTTLSFLPNCHSTLITPQPSPLRIDESLEERARRILGPRIAIHQNDEPIPTLQPPNFVSSGVTVNFSNNYIIRYENNKKQLIDNVQSCLKAMETARQTADHLCELHKRGTDCGEVLKHLFKVHSTSFYLKATTSAQIKAAFSAGLRLSWSDVAEIINALKADVHHEQLFITQLASANYILSKIDNTASIAMSSKLAYHLSKLSR